MVYGIQSFFLHTIAVKNLFIIILNQNFLGLPCIPVWQIYNILTIKFRFNQKNWLGEKKVMTKDEFSEIHEGWTELMTIFDEIDGLNDPAGISEMAVSDTYAAKRASAH
jgi:hypothetical protein